MWPRSVNHIPLDTRLDHYDVLPKSLASVVNRLIFVRARCESSLDEFVLCAINSASKTDGEACVSQLMTAAVWAVPEISGTNWTSSTPKSLGRGSRLAHA